MVKVCWMVLEMVWFIAAIFSLWQGNDLKAIICVLLTIYFQFKTWED